MKNEQEAKEFADIYANLIGKYCHNFFEFLHKENAYIQIGESTFMATDMIDYIVKYEINPLSHVYDIDGFAKNSDECVVASFTEYPDECFTNSRMLSIINYVESDVSLEDYMNRLIESGRKY